VSAGESDVALPAFAPPPLPAELEAELGNLAPVATRRPMRQLAIVCVLSMLYGAVLLTVLSIRRDAGELPMGWMVGGAAAWFLGFVVPSYLALVPAPGSMLARRRYAAAAAITAAVAFVLMGMMIHPAGPSSVQYGAERFLHGHWCLELGLATALVPVILGAVFLRGAVPVGARWIAASLGAGGGSLGGLVLHFHCRITDPLHTGIIHAGVVTVAALLAAALVPRATDVR
jgi:hypothetical protein